MAMLILVELAVAVLGGLVFLALSRGMWSTPTGRQMVIAIAVGTLDSASLLALALRVPLPLWLFAITFGATDFVIVRWVVLRVRALRS